MAIANVFSLSSLSEILNIMDWFPIVFGTFKVVALAIGMFFAIKWHYDQGRKDNASRVAVRTIGKVAALFLLALFGLGFATFTLARKLGMDLTFYW
jgi:hypothetical protein